MVMRRPVPRVGMNVTPVLMEKKTLHPKNGLSVQVCAGCPCLGTTWTSVSQSPCAGSSHGIYMFFSHSCKHGHRLERMMVDRWGH